MLIFNIFALASVIYVRLFLKHFGSARLSSTFHILSVKTALWQSCITLSFVSFSRLFFLLSLTYMLLICFIIISCYSALQLSRFLSSIILLFIVLLKLLFCL